jgi:dTDP-glucose pyrophosphorylase
MTSNQPTLLVLAAGMGTRYGGLKQLESIGPSGETLMDYSIYDARKAGFERVVFLIRKEMQETFEEQVGRKYKNILNVEYAYQDKDDLPIGFSCPTDRQKPWGTGHAVWAAREVLSNCSFGVINADDYYGAETFSQLIDTFSPSPRKIKNYPVQW